MSDQPQDTSETSPQQQAIARLRKMRRFAMLILVLLAASSVWSHLIAPCDARMFIGKRVKVTDILSAELIRIQSAEGLAEEVQLLGIAAPAEPLANDSKQYLTNRLRDKTVIIQFDGTQTRTADGKLLALVYPTENECINMSLVQYGHAFVDRRIHTFLNSQLTQMESEARKKQRGFWPVMKDADQPAWRIEWLKKRFSTTSESGS